jgi:hypothetical protein
MREKKISFVALKQYFYLTWANGSLPGGELDKFV